MKPLNRTSLIAACGMNCAICRVYLRERNSCAGCRASDEGKPVTRRECKIKNCGKLDEPFCFSCNEFPCLRLKNLDKRYRLKYRMSMIDNLLTIKDFGLEKFLETEGSRWTCKKCGGTICVHSGICAACAD